MIKAVLFDMDGTLLDINLEAFIVMYQAHLDAILSQISGKSALAFARPAIKSYLEVARQDRTDSLTNKELYAKKFFEMTGIPLTNPVIYDAINYFEKNVLPQKNSVLINAHPRPGAHACVKAAQALGLKVALATNPTFSPAVINCRMQWGYLDTLGFEYVTHSENSYRLKPSAAYYSRIAEKLGVLPSECLMVGNDPWRDFVAQDIGLRTAFVGIRPAKNAIWRGSCEELSHSLPQIIEELNQNNEQVND